MTVGSAVNGSGARAKERREAAATFRPAARTELTYEVHLADEQDEGSDGTTATRQGSRTIGGALDETIKR